MSRGQRITITLYDEELSALDAFCGRLGEPLMSRQEAIRFLIRQYERHRIGAIVRAAKARARARG